MIKLKPIILGITMLSLFVFMSACATFTPQPEPQANVKATVTAKTGDTVQLFHGGNKLAKEEFCPGETVPVYRYFGFRYKHPVEVGKVKVTQYQGDHFIEGVVVEGNIKDGDVALKPNSACMVRIPEPEKK
jgi:ABC-type Fe3+-hydroxamate transport system substrate-binding protein